MRCKPEGPLTNIAPGSHPEHPLGLCVLQLAQGGWGYRLDLNGYVLGGNSVQANAVLLLQVRVPASKGEE